MGKNIKHLKPPPGTDNFIFPQAQTSSNSRPLLSFFPLFLGLAGAVVEIKPSLEHGEKVVEMETVSEKMPNLNECVKIAKVVKFVCACVCC